MPYKEWKRRKQRDQALRAAFVRMLVRKPVKDVRFSGGNKRVALTFCGERVCYKVLAEREVYIGDWSRRRAELHVDKELFSREHIRSFKALAVHEAVEKLLSEKYGLRVDDEAHAVATAKERQYLRHEGGNWKNHQMVVHRLWLKLDGH